MKSTSVQNSLKNKLHIKPDPVSVFLNVPGHPETLSTIMWETLLDFSRSHTRNAPELWQVFSTWFWESSRNLEHTHVRNAPELYARSDKKTPLNFGKCCRPDSKNVPGILNTLVRNAPELFHSLIHKKRPWTLTSVVDLILRMLREPWTHPCQKRPWTFKCQTTIAHVRHCTIVQGRSNTPLEGCMAPGAIYLEQQVTQITVLAQLHVAWWRNVAHGHGGVWLGEISVLCE